MATTEITQRCPSCRQWFLCKVRIISFRPGSIVTLEIETKCGHRGCGKTHKQPIRIEDTTGLKEIKAT